MKVLFVILLATCISANASIIVDGQPIEGGSTISTNTLADTNYVNNAVSTKLSTNNVKSIVYSNASDFVRSIAPVQLTHSDSMVVDSGAFSMVDLSLGGNVALLPPTNTINGKTLKWRIYGDGAHRTVTISDPKFIITKASTLGTSFIVSNGYVNILLMDAHIFGGVTNWFIESYVPQYKIP